ncbi:hypothetical protein Tco_0543986 [Tanacetum coccineum]
MLGKDKGEKHMESSYLKVPFLNGNSSSRYYALKGTEGAFQQGPVRARVFTDLSVEEKGRLGKADMLSASVISYFKDVQDRFNANFQVRTISRGNKWQEDLVWWWKWNVGGRSKLFRPNRSVCGDNEENVVQSNVSSVQNDALMSNLDEMHEDSVQQGVQRRLANKPNVVVNDSLTSELARYKELVRKWLRPQFKSLTALAVYPPNTPVCLSQSFGLSVVLLRSSLHMAFLVVKLEDKKLEMNIDDEEWSMGALKFDDENQKVKGFLKRTNLVIGLLNI